MGRGQARGRFCGLQAPGRLLGQDGPSLPVPANPTRRVRTESWCCTGTPAGGEELELLDVGVLAVVGLAVPAGSAALGVWALVFMASR